MDALHTVKILVLGHPWLLVAVVIGLVITRSIYQGLSSPLASIPGPWYSLWTDLPSRLRLLHGTRAQYVHALHQRYGPIVRLGPNNVDVSDGNAVRVIHRVKSPFVKSAFYDTGSLYQSMFSLRDPTAHAQRRRMLGPYFSENFLSTLEPIVRELTQQAVRGILEESKGSGCADVLKWWTLFAMDVIGEVSVGESFGMLQNGKKTQFAEDIARSGSVLPLRTAFPLILTLAAWLPFIPLFTDIAAMRGRILAAQKARMTRYLELVEAGDQRRNKTLFAATLKKKQQGEAADLHADELLAEMQSYITAGTDTTAVSLTYLVWAVCRDSAIRERLVHEVQTLPDEFTSAHLRGLPFLNCVIDETLRCHGAVPGALPRDVPNSGVQLCGHYVPGGVTMSTQAYSIHRDPEIFPNPGRFDPSRWEEPSKAMRDNSMAFGIGPRSCVGVHLARMELRFATALLFREAPHLKISSQHGMSNADMEMQTSFLLTPRGHRCLVEV